MLEPGPFGILLSYIPIPHHQIYLPVEIDSKSKLLNEMLLKKIIDCKAETSGLVGRQAHYWALGLFISCSEMDKMNAWHCRQC